MMNVRIAIPEPTGFDEAYNGRSLPQYLAALEAAGASPVVISLRESRENIARRLLGTHGVLLPGSRFDLDPQLYGEERIAECNEPDPSRTAADAILLEHAFNLGKPLLGVCGGMQSLNVWRGGSLVQHLRTGVNHQPGREVIRAHKIEVQPGTKLAQLASSELEELWVNSSHHQAVCGLGKDLVKSGVSPEDEVIEAIEIGAEGHFVLGVQWHPERTFAEDRLSQKIFSALVSAAAAWEARPVTETAAAG